MALIKLVNSNDCMIVDDHMEHVFNHFKWRMDNGYGRAMITRSKIYAHQFIVGKIESGKVIDHINCNRLDNRSENLRVCTQAQNSMNKKSKPRHAIGLRGVVNKRGRFGAYICHNYKHRYLGTFDTPELAAIAYDKEAKRLRGEFAVLNFPEENQAS